MTIYFDNVGNKFLGDCVYANHNISYPNINFLQAHPHSSISAGLTALLTEAGLKFRNVLPQASFDSFTNGLTWFTFAANSDIIDDRYTFSHLNWFSAFTQSTGVITTYNDFGYTSTANAVNNTNAVSVCSGLSTDGTNRGLELVHSENLTWCGVANTESLGLFLYNYKISDNLNRFRFFYAGTLDSVNTNGNYYSNNQITKSIAFFTDRQSQLKIYGQHFIAGASKRTLLTGDAIYPITCADGQTSTAQWATDFYIFDNNASLGFPVIGRVRNLLLAQGSYTIGKPVKIQGAVSPDNGFNCWLPVGTFADKTVLMRCYSSV